MTKGLDCIPTCTDINKYCAPCMIYVGHEMSWEEKQHHGKIMAAALQQWYLPLVEGLDPVETAKYLYGLTIISNSELEKATNEAVHGNQKERSDCLTILLIRKINANPCWFNDICVALEKGGVQSIVKEVKGT